MKKIPKEQKNKMEFLSEKARVYIWIELEFKS